MLKRLLLALVLAACGGGASALPSHVGDPTPPPTSGYRILRLANQSRPPYNAQFITYGCPQGEVFTFTIPPGGQDSPDIPACVTEIAVGELPHYAPDTICKFYLKEHKTVNPSPLSKCWFSKPYPWDKFTTLYYKFQ